MSDAWIFRGTEEVKGSKRSNGRKISSQFLLLCIKITYPFKTEWGYNVMLRVYGSKKNRFDFPPFSDRHLGWLFGWITVLDICMPVPVSFALSSAKRFLIHCIGTEY
ncbi:hypothetical protein K435DRAFT_84008 [Dendrothele bispora CBS 962.96]|uniref:Uncharacterized protein n=1 Tax=Dendrothele bispora (strain CBS 962.96) TaxID=1314807 RepID=A0A4S8M3V8_DENBC|nr:hypothetical protein K435DRAFT_84008 [Dendrothele bispora CBS 962.96]